MPPPIPLLAALTVACVYGIEGNVHAVLLYKDASAPVNTRVADLLKRMTLEEKVAALVPVAVLVP